jgi:hypothetical protein
MAMFVDMQRCACVCEKRKILSGAFVCDLLKSCGAVERLDHTAHVESLKWREKKNIAVP